MKEALHQLNIFIHILFGSLAILVGFLPILSPKGKTFHIKTGKIYLILLSVVLLTGIIGALLFKFRPFLFLLTVLVFYTPFVGIRTLKLKQKKPKLLDNLVYALGLITVIAYFYFFDWEAAKMNKTVVLSTTSVLLIHVVYDLAKTSILPNG